MWGYETELSFRQKRDEFRSFAWVFLTRGEHVRRGSQCAPLLRSLLACVPLTLNLHSLILFGTGMTMPEKLLRQLLGRQSRRSSRLAAFLFWRGSWPSFMHTVVERSIGTTYIGKEAGTSHLYSTSRSFSNPAGSM